MGHLGCPQIVEIVCIEGDGQGEDPNLELSSDPQSHHLAFNGVKNYLLSSVGKAISLNKRFGFPEKVTVSCESFPNKDLSPASGVPHLPALYKMEENSPRSPLSSPSFSLTLAICFL